MIVGLTLPITNFPIGMVIKIWAGGAIVFIVATLIRLRPWEEHP